MISGLSPCLIINGPRGNADIRRFSTWRRVVPPVCSDVGGNNDIVEHGKEGYVASSDNDFFQYLEVLINNKGMRCEMGLQSRRKVEERFSVKCVASKLANILGLV